MSKPAQLKKTLAFLVKAAASGRTDLAWLRQAIKKAGYVPAAEVITKSETRAVAAAFADALAAAEVSATNPCCREVLAHVEETLSKIAGQPAR